MPLMQRKLQRAKAASVRGLLLIAVFLLIISPINAGWDLQIRAANDPCTNSTNSFDIRVYNTGSAAADVSNLCIRIYLNESRYAASDISAHNSAQLSNTIDSHWQSPIP